MAVFSSVLQLVAAVSSITFVLVTGVTACSGSGPRSSSPLGAGRRAGRAADGPDRAQAGDLGRLRRWLVGCALTALATNLDSTPR